MSKAVFKSRYLTQECLRRKGLGFGDSLEVQVCCQRPPEKEGEEQEQ